jgi:DME family drug/metabolite transporter
MKQLRGNFLVLAAAILWGTTGTSQALAPAGATPPIVGTLRLAVGGLALLVYAIFRRSSGSPWAELRTWPLRALLGAAVCMAAYQLCFFAGVARTGVAVGTIVGIGSAPILGGVLGYFFRGERPGWAWLVATLLAVAGVGLLSLPVALRAPILGTGDSTGGVVQVDPLGLVLAAAAGGAYATFTLFNKQLIEGRRPEAVQAAVFLLGAALLLPWLWTADLGWVAQPAGLLVILHLGLVTVGIGYTLFSLGLQRVPVSTAVTLTLAEPMTAGILGVIVLGEQLTLQSGLGILLVFSGLAVLSFHR